MSPDQTLAFHPAWSQSLNSSPRGLALVRERDWVLAWDQNHWLHLFDHAGQRQGQLRFAGDLVAACCADDGSAYAAVGSGGEICGLAPDLMTRWQQTMPCPALAVAMDPFGQYLAVSDSRGNLHLFNRLGQPVNTVQTPRPLCHVAFVPSAAVLVGCADYGLVSSFDMAGATRWRDGLVANAGALSVNGDGSRIVIACFSEGLQSYNLNGTKQARIAVSEPCRLVSIAFSGRFMLVAGMTDHLFLLDAEGKGLASHKTEAAIAAIAMSALGDHVVVALTDGQIVRLNVQKNADERMARA